MCYNITPKEVYKFLKSDNEITKIYDEIWKREVVTSDRAFHNMDHINNVSLIAEKILKDLNASEDTIYNCKIACLLHDVGVLEGKDGHAERSYEYAKKLFENKKWIFKGLEEVLDAIKNHSEGYESDNLIRLAIILADKLDIKKTRISEEGKKVEGNRQYGHIEDIVIDLHDNNLSINFITDGNINIKEINNYYFTGKVFKAIEAFSKRMDLNYCILMDNNNWKI